MQQVGDRDSTDLQVVGGLHVQGAEGRQSGVEDRVGLRKVGVLEVETQELLVPPWELSREERAVEEEK